MIKYILEILVNMFFAKIRPRMFYAPWNTIWQAYSLIAYVFEIFRNCSDSDIANTWKYKHHIQIYVGVSLENILEVVDVKTIVNTFFFLFRVAYLLCIINKTVCDRKSFFIRFERKFRVEYAVIKIMAMNCRRLFISP